MPPKFAFREGNFIINTPPRMSREFLEMNRKMADRNRKGGIMNSLGALGFLQLIGRRFVELKIGPSPLIAIA